MSKQKTQFICQSCCHNSPKWIGKCPECQQWNSFEEELIQGPKSQIHKIKASGEAKKISDIKSSTFERIITGVSEFDRVVGGGLIPGSLILIGGQPGIGKSTILMKVFGELSRKYPQENFLYISGEESEAQIADRSKRLGSLSDNFFIYHTSSWQDIEDEIKRLKPKFLVVDSIQTISSNMVSSAAGTISQIREVTHEILTIAKAKNITSFIVGHVTKEGQIAGPKILEHMVDTVISFEGDQNNHYRILRSIKNRFGNTNEVGIFEMSEHGLNEVSNPSQFFIDVNSENTSGRALACVMEGTRAILLEIQGLIVDNSQGNGRRSTQGLDYGRLTMLVAVIEKYFQIPLSFNDIYLNAVGGIKVTSRECDLAIVAALMSSLKNKAIANDIVFMGEVGLTGEVRGLPNIETKLRELNHLGYRKVIVSKKSLAKNFNLNGMELLGIEKIQDLDEYII